MSALVRQDRHSSRSESASFLPLGVFVLGSLSCFLLAPGTIAGKTHLALHGLCAQRPSHSLAIGTSLLPLDARMSGMYIGAATTVAYLLAMGRLRAATAPPRSVFALMTLFVLALAGDGVNALLTDLGLPHLYQPSNALRLATGTLSGLSLGVALSCLFGASVWAEGDRTRAVIGRPVELVVPGAIATAIGGLALSGLPVLFAPFAVGLLLSAVAVIAMMGIVLLTLLGGPSRACASYSELAPLALAGLVSAVVVMSGLSLLRLAAERFLGLPQLT
jgi:uncharacterized membrane protein